MAKFDKSVLTKYGITGTTEVFILVVLLKISLLLMMKILTIQYGGIQKNIITITTVLQKKLGQQ